MIWLKSIWPGLEEWIAEESSVADFGVMGQKHVYMCNHELESCIINLSQKPDTVLELSTNIP